MSEEKKLSQEDIKEQTPNSKQEENKKSFPPEALPGAIGTETSNIGSQTTTMEVHKHPQHVTHKKKWGEYVLEFLMIFLAVTLGFFAETIREHITEQKRAKEFARSMVNDLQEDTAQLKSYKEYFNDAANYIDTLLELLTVAELKDIPTGKLYWYGLWGGARRYFIPNDATFQQMKNSGSLRYFKKAIAGKVANYDRFCRLMQNIEEKQQGVYVEVRKIRAELFDFRYNDIANTIEHERRITGNYSKIDSFMKTNPPLLSLDKTLFNQYVELVRSRFIRTTLIVNADSLLNSASVLIQDLRKEYSLEND